MEDIVEAEAVLLVAVRFDFSFFFFLLVALSVVELDSGPAGAAGGSSAELPRLRFDRRDDDFGGIPSSGY